MIFEFFFDGHGAVHSDYIRFQTQIFLLAN